MTFKEELRALWGDRLDSARILFMCAVIITIINIGFWTFGIPDCKYTELTFEGLDKKPITIRSGNYTAIKELFEEKMIETTEGATKEQIQQLTDRFQNNIFNQTGNIEMCEPQIIKKPCPQSTCQCEKTICTLPIATTTTIPPKPTGYCQWLRDYKCNKWESPGLQYGCVYAWDEISSELGCRNRTRFNPGPSLSMNINTIWENGNTQPKNPGQYTFNTFEYLGNDCFNLSQYPDNQSRKRWNWNKDKCSGSMLTVCHI